MVTDRGDEPGAGIGDDQLDTSQAAVTQLSEDLGPQVLDLAADGTVITAPSG